MNYCIFLKIILSLVSDIQKRRYLNIIKYRIHFEDILILLYSTELRNVNSLKNIAEKKRKNHLDVIN